mmetsp:Transcript_1905/g.5645  ORF Transcript_1905/g.5645 Transcript_1905/m.5645 type:complete len:290 (+) Transcript_1905:399-1268(+)
MTQTSPESKSSTAQPVIWWTPGSSINACAGALVRDRASTLSKFVYVLPSMPTPSGISSNRHWSWSSRGFAPRLMTTQTQSKRSPTSTGRLGRPCNSTQTSNASVSRASAGLGPSSAYAAGRSAHSTAGEAVDAPSPSAASHAHRTQPAFGGYVGGSMPSAASLPPVSRFAGRAARCTVNKRRQTAPGSNATTPSDRAGAVGGKSAHASGDNGGGSRDAKPGGGRSCVAASVQASSIVFFTATSTTPSGGSSRGASSVSSEASSATQPGGTRGSSHAVAATWRGASTLKR